MFTASARAAFHRLAARAHERCLRAGPSTHRGHEFTEAAQDRTDEAWSASCDWELSNASDAEGRAANEASVHATDGLHRNATGWHRVAAKRARGA